MHLSTEDVGSALSQSEKLDKPYLCRIFPTQELDRESISLFPLVRCNDGSGDASFVLPIDHLLAVDAFSYYHLFLLSPPLYRFDGQSLL